MGATPLVPLAPYTTFRIGGPARFFSEAHSEAEVQEAIAEARTNRATVFPLGAGSNLLVPDSGIEGFVLKISIPGISFEEEGSLLISGAGVLWEAAVEAAGQRGLFGIENLAGIPGSIGGAAVQNIGAYGAELSSVFAYAEVIHSETGEKRRIAREDAAFGYRDSFFKKHPEWIIVRVALRLKDAEPNLSYTDLARAEAAGEPLSTPSEIALAVRAIRSRKFPGPSEEGTAGSFFKNPVISRATAESLMERFPGLPVFMQGTDQAKVPLAWILDNALHLKGFAQGGARLYEKHPLIIVAREGARAEEVEALATEVARRVFEATGIRTEREVETFGAR